MSRSENSWKGKLRSCLNFTPGTSGENWDPCGEHLPPGAVIHEHHAYLKSQPTIPITPIPLIPAPVLGGAIG